MKKKLNAFMIIGLLLIAAALVLTAYNFWDNYRAGKTAQAFLDQLTPAMGTDPVPAGGRPVYYHTASTTGEIDGEAPAAPGEAAEGETGTASGGSGNAPSGGNTSGSGTSSGTGAPGGAEGSSAEPQLPDAMEYPDYELAPEMPMPKVKVEGKEYVGVVSIPAIWKDLPVFDEWDYTKLNYAPCRYSGSVYMDNMIICAHNYGSHFGAIRDLRYGDDVYFTDGDGNVFHYTVSEIENLRPNQTDALLDGDWDLTLFTCTIGGRTRVVVRCFRADT